MVIILSKDFKIFDNKIIILFILDNSPKPLSIEQIKDKLTLLIKNKMTPKDAILAVSLLFNINKNIVKKIYYSI